MMLELAEMRALIERCAPNVAHATLLGIAKVESGFDPLAIGVNGPPHRQVRSTNAPDAIAAAKRLIESGASVDLGLAQINSRNLDRLNLSIEAAFDPCENLAASATVLREGFDRARAADQAPQTALRMALSHYNTGHPERGIRNGYVAKVVAAAERFSQRDPTPVETEPPAPSWDAFAVAREVKWRTSFVFSPQPEPAQ